MAFFSSLIHDHNTMIILSFFLFFQDLQQTYIMPL